MKTAPVTQPRNPSLDKPTTCTHSRLVDDVLSRKGTKTGRLICLECKAVFPDPAGH